jgi:hypothetical protein
MGVPTVFMELGMPAGTGTPCQMNKSPDGGPGANASDASGGGGGGGGGSGGDAPAPPGGNKPGAGGGGGGGGGGSASGASASSPAPTAEERKLAAAPGDSPEQRAAREKVVRDFYGDKPGLGQQRADQDMGMYGNPPVANAHPQGYGIDLSKPVSVTNFPPPPTMDQYVRNPGGYPGNYFDPVGGQSGNAIGLNTDPNFRKPTTFDVPPGGGQGLNTTAGPVQDTWTDNSGTGRQPWLEGGGQQTTVDNNTRSGFRCSKCGGNPCTCPGPLS